MFSVNPRVSLGPIIFTFIIQKSENSGKSSGLSEKFAHWNSITSSDFPSGLRPSGKSNDSREFPRANFSRQPCSSQSFRDGSIILASAFGLMFLLALLLSISSLGPYEFTYNMVLLKISLVQHTKLNFSLELLKHPLLDCV